MNLVTILSVVLLAGPVVGNLAIVILRACGLNAWANRVAQISPFVMQGVQITEDVAQAAPKDRLGVFVADIEKAGTLDEAKAIGVRLKAALGIGAALMFTACGAPPTGAQVQAGITAGEDLSNAVCAVLEGIPQTDTSTTQFVCSVIPKLGATTPPKTFLVSIPKASASKFADAHCVKDGSGAPTP